MTLNPPANDNSLVVRRHLEPIQPYLDDPEVTEVIINRPGSMFVYRGGKRAEVDKPELTSKHIDGLIRGLATYNGLREQPIMSVVLPGQQRGQIVKPPAIIDGTVAINIRTNRRLTKTLEQLSDEGAFAVYRDVSPSEMLSNAGSGASPPGERLLTEDDKVLLELKRNGHIAEFLEQAILRRKNIVIAGATGSGKTLVTRSIIERIPKTERIITIEDVHELFLPDYPNRVHLLYGSSVGRVSATECIRACMRMTPDRIFLAELRGDEAWEYLQALNTGHPGSITTTHANDAKDTFNRLALLIKQSPVGQMMDLQTIRWFLYTTIDVVLFFSQYRLREIWFDPLFARTYE